MPVIFYNGGYENEQVKGGDTINSFMRGYLVRRNEPLNLIFIGGHEISDAPTFSETEGLMIPRRVNQNGRNIVREERLTSEVIKSVTLNLTLPSRAVSVTDRVFQQQNNCDFDVLFVPNQCDTNCDEYFYLGLDVTLGSKRMSNGILGFDDNEAPIEWTRTLMFTGNFIQYNGMEAFSLSDASEALYDALVLDASNEGCVGCDCPYQTIYRVGGGATVGLVELSVDGGETWASLDISQITTDMGVAIPIITSIVIADGRIVVGYSDVAGGTGTDGGVAYLDGNNIFQLSTFDVASTGVQDLIVINDKVYAFGTAGQIFVSDDGGINFTLLVQTAITADILAVDYDAINNYLWIGTAAGGLFRYNFTSFTDLSAEIGTAGDIVSVLVPVGDQVIVSDSLGGVYENWETSDADTFTQTAALGSSTVVGGEGGLNFRVLAGAGNTVFRRDAYNLQKFESYTTISGNVTKIFAPQALADEGSSYFAVVSNTGETVLVKECGICIENQ